MWVRVAAGFLAGLSLLVTGVWLGVRLAEESGGSAVPASVAATTTADDAAAAAHLHLAKRLREARAMFDAGLVTEQQYNDLRAELIGFDWGVGGEQKKGPMVSRSVRQGSVSPQTPPSVAAVRNWRLRSFYRCSQFAERRRASPVPGDLPCLHCASSSWLGPHFPPSPSLGIQPLGRRTRKQLLHLVIRLAMK
jgi:hypothetical protein